MAKKKPGYMTEAINKAKKKFAKPTPHGPTKAAKAKVKTKPAKKKGPKPPSPVAVRKPSTAAQETEGTYQDYPILAGLPDLVAEHQDCHTAIKVALASVASITGPAESRKKVLAAELEALLLAADLDGTSDEGVTVGARRVKRIEVEGEEYVDPILLLEAGVEADTVKACTKRKDGYSYALVINPRVKGQVAQAADAVQEEGAGHGRKKYA